MTQYIILPQEQVVS